MVKRLIQLLQQREKMLGLGSDEYQELYELLKQETEKTKETLDFYNSYIMETPRPKGRTKQNLEG
jgi:hypothetical protein